MARKSRKRTKRRRSRRRGGKRLSVEIGGKCQRSWPGQKSMCKPPGVCQGFKCVDKNGPDYNPMYMTQSTAQGIGKGAYNTGAFIGDAIVNTPGVHFGGKNRRRKKSRKRRKSRRRRKSRKRR